MSHVHEDLDTLLQNDSGRKLFALFLKEFNNSSDNLLTLYLICSCFQNQRIDDRHRIKQILEKTYQACFVKNQLPYLNPELKQKLCDSLKKNTYNESIFNAVKKELKNILENEYFPLFLNSKIYMENMTNKNHTEQKTYQFDDILTDSKSSTFKNPKTISSLSIGNQRKISKNNSHLSTSTRSINQLNESNLSLNIRSSRYIPPNPYSVITKPIPVSCQDSEIQSVVSQDDRYSKLDKNIKKNLIANKNAKLNMPEFQPNPDEPTVPLKTHTNAKKSQVPLSESDPKKFFELVACKLEAVLNGGEYRTRKRSLSNSNLNEEDIDDQLDEHLDRVYNNNNHHHKVQSPKMCIKKSDQLSHKFNNLSINHAKQKSHHHFYQLTSTSKEVDIDSQHNNLISSVDSGVSTRSVASIERVNDWLTNSKNNDGSNVEKCKKIEEENLNVKTTVAYYLPGEDLAYISTFNGKYLTLAQFKQLITKKGSFRYFFKTKSDLLDEECVVYQEATDDMAYVPMFNNKVIAKIEKLNGGAH